jgi:hypothetical protein
MVLSNSDFIMVIPHNNFILFVDNINLHDLLYLSYKIITNCALSEQKNLNVTFYQSQTHDKRGPHFLPVDEQAWNTRVMVSCCKVNTELRTIASLPTTDPT